MGKLPFTTSSLHISGRLLLTCGESQTSAFQPLPISYLCRDHGSVSTRAFMKGSTFPSWKSFSPHNSNLTLSISLRRVSSMLRGQFSTFLLVQVSQPPLNAFRNLLVLT